MGDSFLVEVLAQSVMGAPVFGLVLMLGVLALGTRLYARCIRQVAQGEGRVAVLPFSIMDLLIILVLGGWLVAGVIAAIMRGVGEPDAVSNKGLLESMVLFTLIVVGLGWFLQSRKISLAALFGVREMPLWKAAGLGILYMVLGYPFIILCMEMMARILGEQAASQKVIEFYLSAAASHDWVAIGAIFMSAVIIAPLAEEFVFRGYIYGALRRYGGPWVAMSIAALFFAAIHFNALGFLSFFVLSLCFTLAYEATGSLVVPIVMHALFNLATLVRIFFMAQQQP